MFKNFFDPKNQTKWLSLEAQKKIDNDLKVKQNLDKLRKAEPVSPKTWNFIQNMYSNPNTSGGGSASINTDRVSTNIPDGSLK